MTILSGCRALGMALLTLAAVGSGTVAHAQKIERPLAIKLGIHIASDGIISQEVGEVWFFGGLSFDIARTRPQSNLIYQVYTDYAHRESWGGGGTEGSYFSGKGNLFGIGPAVKLLLAPARAPGQPYVGIGGGYYTATVPKYGTVYGFSGEPLGRGLVGERTDARLGGKVFAGYQVNTGFFWEVDYTYVNPIDGLMPGGIGARLGFRL